MKNITHPEMVSRLVKPGAEVLKNLTPEEHVDIELEVAQANCKHVFSAHSNAYYHCGIDFSTLKGRGK